MNEENINNAQGDFNENMYSMCLHLSQFSGYFVPVAGMIVPIIMWQIKKKESQFIDQNGKVVANWIISCLIYMMISGILCILLIGIPLLIAFAIMAIIFPIIGGIKANDGTLWKYPLSIQFFKIEESAPKE